MSECMRSYWLNDGRPVTRESPKITSAMRSLIGGQVLAEVKTECLWARTGPLPNPNISNLVDDGRLCTMAFLSASNTAPVLRTNLTEGVSFDVIVANRGIEWLFPRAADFLTATLRSASDDMVYGRSYSSERYTQVRWVWFMIPCSIVGLGVVFLLTTIWITWALRDPLWKTSGIPMSYLRQQRDGEEERDLHQVPCHKTNVDRDSPTPMLLGALEKQAKHDRVLLQGDDERGACGCES